MAKEEGLGSVKRFGVRYGRTGKFKLAKIEKVQKMPQKCPYCNKMQAKRISVGLYVCYNCKSKFTGKAYSVEQKIVTKELPEENVEAVQEFEEEIIEGDS